MPEVPLCFVAMPFGVKPDGRGGSVDFDAVYRELLVPAIRAAELEPLRADQELVGGIVHKPMFERLVLADYAIADLTTANANVYYELSCRHAMGKAVIYMAVDPTHLPFHVFDNRTIFYTMHA